MYMYSIHNTAPIHCICVMFLPVRLKFPALLTVTLLSEPRFVTV